jgi:ribokinase
MSRASSVVSLGSINVDFQVRADGWPEQSETAIAGDFLMAGGGKAANVAFIAARLGASPRLVGRVGDDGLADLALSPLRSVGVDVSRVRRSLNTATGVSMIVVRADGDKTIVLASNANLRWEAGAEQDVVEAIASVPAGSIVALDLEVPAELARAGAKAARSRGLTTVLDPSPADAVTGELLSLADYVTPNTREAERLTGIHARSESDATRAGRKLLERGVGHACMKLSDGGVVCVHRDGIETVRAPRVEVVDKTGAGDAFAGALCALLGEGRGLRECLRGAVAASTLALKRYGSQAAYPSREELEAFMVQVPA